MSSFCFPFKMALLLRSDMGLMAHQQKKAISHQSPILKQKISFNICTSQRMEARNENDRVASP